MSTKLTIYSWAEVTPRTVARANEALKKCMVPAKVDSKGPYNIEEAQG